MIARMFAVTLAACLCAAWSDRLSIAETLEGHISEEEYGRRRLERTPSADADLKAPARSRRIARPDAASQSVPPLAEPQQPRRSDFDEAATGATRALKAQASFTEASKLPLGTFDIGADRGSRELVLAWERWHHQFAESLYFRWTRRVAQVPAAGEGTAVIKVTRDHHIEVELVGQSGSPYVATTFIDAIHSLDGNPGLTFPVKSQRTAVTFTHTGRRSPFVRPGYDWDRNDYEKVRNEY